ncbi:MAG: hypothetical protein IPP77_11295 [Bacteroidetes bacterium]|nr:hypothetical protein [Bacteroidota bacterium]
MGEDFLRPRLTASVSKAWTPIGQESSKKAHHKNHTSVKGGTVKVKK